MYYTPLAHMCNTRFIHLSPDGAESARMLRSMCSSFVEVELKLRLKGSVVKVLFENAGSFLSSRHLSSHTKEMRAKSEAKTFNNFDNFIIYLAFFNNIIHRINVTIIRFEIVVLGLAKI